ncbi:hypothetical protein [Nocardioides bruguierae]|uniref:Uncharacterized protein n=1 Tax=Nocardioides bruguierae TaxID=2945102 RepID=A0A9X2D8C1_9ACTN|nr:hypothetical protein [Nocardioides bruguierae]MCL8024186.1 hypothetical protein [Nocardioides bruguierae]MCM0619889.1 hypothetical protein [Nocardioides bruguierae]
MRSPFRSPSRPTPAPTGAHPGPLAGAVRPPSPALPVAVALLVLSTGLAATVLLGIGNALVVAAFLALLAVAALAAAGTALALVLRRRLAEMRHLPDLGRHFVTSHEHGRVTDISSEGGGMTLHVAADEVQTMVMDEQGAPDHVSGGGAGTSAWRIPAQAHLSPEQRRVVQQLVADRVPVRVVSSGVVGLGGPVAQGWRLEAGNGLVLSGHA